LNVVHLWIYQHLTSLVGIPILADPVIEMLARLEVVGEPATRSGRNALAPDQGDEQCRKVAAGADNALSGDRG
jgi:hypothetical protein